MGHWLASPAPNRGVGGQAGRGGWRGLIGPGSSLLDATVCVIATGRSSHSGRSGCFYIYIDVPVVLVLLFLNRFNTCVSPVYMEDTQ